MKKNPPKPKTPQDAGTKKPHSSGIKWYDEDNLIISKVLQQGLIFGVRLNMAQAVRMLVRNADLKKLTAEDYAKAATADDGRRKKEES